MSAKLTGEEYGHKSSELYNTEASSREILLAIPHPTSLHSATFPPGEGIFRVVEGADPYSLVAVTNIKSVLPKQYAFIRYIRIKPAR